MPKRKTAKKRAVKKPKNRLFLPYPLIIFLLLCAGVFLVNSTFKAGAQDIKITASIQGPPVTDPATITSPADGAHFSAVPIVVTGTCTTNAVYVEIFRNSVMSGSAICDGSSNFELQIDLFAGKNDLTAHSFNVNDNEGPVSAVVTVYYDVPVPPPGEPAPSGSGGTSTPVTSSSNPPIILKTPFIYKGYFVDQEIVWPLEISGGNSPYAFNINWGDGSDSVISRKNDGAFNIKHTYKKPGGYKGTYSIKVQASDADGNYAYLEFFVLVNAKASAAPIGSIYSKPPPSLGGLATWLWVAWPAYLSLALMAIAFKLGEREEFMLLRKKGALRRS